MLDLKVTIFSMVVCYRFIPVVSVFYLNRLKLAKFVAYTPSFCPDHPAWGVVKITTFVKKRSMVTEAEKENLVNALVVAFDKFISVFQSFEETTINRVPFTGSWTPAQVAHHVCLATDGVPDGKTGSADRRFDSLLPAIRPWWEDLNQRFTSPEPLRPDDKSRTKAELLYILLRVRQKDIDIATTADLTLACLDFALPTIGYLTRFEWLWFIEMHLTRHTAQLERIAKHHAQKKSAIL
jgi:DinB superfamily